MMKDAHLLEADDPLCPLPLIAVHNEHPRAIVPKRAGWPASSILADQRCQARFCPSWLEPETFAFDF